jgi:hypothetical protein
LPRLREGRCGARLRSPPRRDGPQRGPFGVAIEVAGGPIASISDHGFEMIGGSMHVGNGRNGGVAQRRSGTTNDPVGRVA